ncbi:hypothetical protein L914_13847 [Phytophthora nicotianae]|uniref:Uncharacterized protein n=1 Tax=Phytophthora nicotianae TaxID=4792 RepID=W2MXA7_PHYNI|nr:hypothetical protein L914_13847 [Phytophthora nicotianae]
MVSSRPEASNKVKSCERPSAGPNKWAIMPSGVVTAWYFTACMRLYPLYIALCSKLSPGRQIGQTNTELKLLSDRPNFFLSSHQRDG